MLCSGQVARGLKFYTGKSNHTNTYHIHCQGHWQIKRIKCSLEFHNCFVSKTVNRQDKNLKSIRSDNSLQTINVLPMFNCPAILLALTSQPDPAYKNLFFVVFFLLACDA